MGVTSFQQSLYEFFDSGLLFRIALLQKTILFLLFSYLEALLRAADITCSKEGL